MPRKGSPLAVRYWRNAYKAARWYHLRMLSKHLEIWRHRTREGHTRRSEMDADIYFQLRSKVAIVRHGTYPALGRTAGACGRGHAAFRRLCIEDLTRCGAICPQHAQESKERLALALRAVPRPLYAATVARILREKHNFVSATSTDVSPTSLRLDKVDPLYRDCIQVVCAMEGCGTLQQACNSGAHF